MQNHSLPNPVKVGRAVLSAPQMVKSTNLSRSTLPTLSRLSRFLRRPSPRFSDTPARASYALTLHTLKKAPFAIGYWLLAIGSIPTRRRSDTPSLLRFAPRLHTLSRLLTFSRCHAFTLLTIATSLCLTTGCSKSAKASRHAHRADKYFSAGDYPRAEIEYLNALQLGGINPRIVAQLGNIYYEQGRLARAYAFLTNAASLSPTNLDLQVKIGQIYLGVRQTRESREIATRVLEQRPADPDAPILLAESVASRKEADQVAARLTELSSKLGETAPLQTAEGVVKVHLGDLPAAEAVFKKAVQTDPRFASAHHALGTLYASKGDLKAADTEMKAAMDGSPPRSTHRVAYADFKLRSGDLVEGKRLLAQFSKASPDYLPAWLKQAEIALSEKQYTNCASLLAQAFAHDPGNIEALLLRGKLMLAQGENTKAIGDFQQATKISPRSGQAHFYLALAQLAKNDTTEALKNLNKAVTLDPTAPEGVLLLAELNIRTGNASAAIASLKEFTQKHPQIPQGRLLLATAYLTTKDLEDANAVYQEMMPAFPNSPQVPFLLGTVLVQQKKPAEARKAFEQSLARATNYLPAIEQLVELDLNANQYSQALNRVALEIENYPKAAPLQLLAARVHVAKAQDCVKSESEKKGLLKTSSLTITDVPAAAVEAEEAEAALSKAIELDPAYRPAYLMLAQVYVSHKKHQQALDRLATLANTNDVSALMQVGMIHEALKEYAAARDAYEKLLSVNPRFTMAMNNLAYLYSEHFDQQDKAYELADKARQLLPSDPFAADTLGWILYRRHEYVRAEGLIEESSRRLQDQPEIQYHLGMARYMMGDEDGAKTALEAAAASPSDFQGKDQIAKRLAILSLDPSATDDMKLHELEKDVVNSTDPVALSRLAAIYERRAAFRKAATSYEQILKANPKNIVAVGKLARLYMGPLQDNRKALELVREAHRVAPDDPSISHLLGRLVYEDGDVKWSLSLLQDAVRKIPDDAVLLHDFAWASYSMGNTEDAVTSMENAVQRGLPSIQAEDAKLFVEFAPALRDAPEHVPAQNRVQDILKSRPAYLPALMASATLAERAGKFESAKATYEKIILDHPLFSPATRSLALLDLRAFRNDPQAYAFAAKAREAYPDDPAVARALGIITYLRANDDSRAIALLKEAAQKVQNDPELLYYLAMAHLRQKQPAQTRDALRRALDLNLGDKLAADARRVLAELK